MKIEKLCFPDRIEGGELPTVSDLLWVCYSCGFCQWTNRAAWGRVVWHKCTNENFVRRMYEATDKEYNAARAIIR